MARDIEAAVENHYSRRSLLATIEAALEAADVDPKNPAIEDLAPVDEFHTAGRATTLKALEHMDLKPGMHVLDAGCGIGGTARCLAHDFGCQASGIDLTSDFIETAAALTKRVGLSERCTFQTGSVLDLPYDGESFDAAVTFHVAMNISDRDRFYREVHRVLKHGAEFCVFDVMKGPGDGMRYPVPWAETAETSFLKSQAETAAHLEAAGFAHKATENLREYAMDFFAKVFSKLKETGGPPPVGLHLLTGENTSEKFGNYADALSDHQIEPVITVWTKT